MVMSTDKDIVDTTLNSKWEPIDQRYSWQQVKSMELNVSDRATIVVLAHGNGSEIGNANPGEIDIDASTFLALIQSNMDAHTTPSSVYISTCGPGIAEFAANVRLTAEQNDVWKNTRIFGHNDPVSGPVPPPNDMSWTEIF